MITSGLPRAVETARIVAPDREPEAWPAFRELEGGRLRDVADPEAAFVERVQRFASGGRDVPRRRDDRLAARPRRPGAAASRRRAGLGRRARRRARRHDPRAAVVRAHRRPRVPRQLRARAGVDLDPRRRRGLDRASRERDAVRSRAHAHAPANDGGAMGSVQEHVEHDAVVELIRREPTDHDAIRELWKKHSIAEDARDLPGADLDADAGLRLRARADRPPVGGPRGRDAFLHRAADRVPGHPLRPHRHRDRAAGRLRGGARDGNAQGALGRQRADRRAAHAGAS